MTGAVRAAGCVAATLALACAAGLQRGPPLADPTGVASAARDVAGTAAPVRVVFEWEYADERGNLRGEGAARVNPPDRFRLDLFSTGEGSMRAVLVDDALWTSGDLEGVELPRPAFLYAMTGVFRPGAAAPIEGFEDGTTRVVAYAAEDGAVRYFHLREGRLERVEERSGDRLIRRIELEWGEDPTWPREAVYRDDVTPSRVRWELVRVVGRSEPWPEEIYEVPGG